MNEMAEHVDVLKNPLIRRLIAFDLDRDDFVILGSAPLLAHGLRRSIRDLDVVARGAAWRRASELGIPAVGTISGDPVVHLCGGRIQVSQKWISKAWNTDDLIDQAEIIQGLRFARLADVLAYKQMLMRPKDIPDIQALTQLLGAGITDYRTAQDEASNPATPFSNSARTRAKNPTRRPGPPSYDTGPDRARPSAVGALQPRLARTSLATAPTGGPSAPSASASRFRSRRHESAPSAGAGAVSRRLRPRRTAPPPAGSSAGHVRTGQGRTRAAALVPSARSRTPSRICDP